MAHDSSKDPGYSQLGSDAGSFYQPPAATSQASYGEGILEGPSITGKSQKILDLEKKLGITINAYYNTVGGGGSKADSRQVGAPISYSYDNGQGQLVYLDENGDYLNTVKPQSFLEQILPVLGVAAGATFLGPAISSLFGSGAATGAAGAAGSALTPAAIESLAGTAGYGVNASALNAAAAAGIPAAAVGANALSEIPGAMTSPVLNSVSAATPLTDIANLTTPNVGAMGSANQAVASGMSPGSVGAASAAGGALTPAELAAASGTTTLGNIAVPAAISANEAVASGMSPGSAGAAAAAGAATGAGGGLTPAELAAAQGVATAGSSVADLTANATNAALANNPSLIKQLQDATGLTGTQLAALLSGGVNAASAANISSAIGAGLKGQQEATKASQDVLKGVYNQQLGFQQPYQGAGVNAINQLGQLGSGQYQQYDPVTGQPTTTGAGSGYLTHQFNAADLAGGLAPNYDFMLQQGQMANQRAANVGGGALSGNTLQGLQKYTQDYAGNAYQNAFQNYQTQRNNIYNNLSNMAGIGQTANQQAGTAGQAYGTGITGLNTGLANATAAAMLGQAQAAGGGANSLANSTFLAALLGQK